MVRRKYLHFPFSCIAADDLTVSTCPVSSCIISQTILFTVLPVKKKKKKEIETSLKDHSSAKTQNTWIFGGGGGQGHLLSH